MSQAIAQEETYQWQKRRVNDWENYWQQRLKMLAAGPGLGTTPWAVRSEYQRQLEDVSARLRGTLFDPASGEAANCARRAALKAPPHHFRRDALVDWELTFLKRRFQHFERQMALSLKAGATIEQMMQHYTVACGFFCRAGEPVLMCERLIIAGEDVDLWPMLAGLATAHLSTPRMFRGRREKRLEALKEIFWQTHPRQQVPSPSPYQLQCVLQEQALVAVQQFLPMQTMETAKRQTFNQLQKLCESVASSADHNPQNPQHLEMLLTPQTVWKDMAGRSKRSHQLLLGLGSESAKALLRLPGRVDGFVIAQRSKPVVYESEMYDEDAPGESMIESRRSVHSLEEAGIEESFLLKEEAYQALKSLKPALRETVLLDADEWTYEQIARELHVSVETVRSRLRRVRKAHKVIEKII